MPLDLSGIQVPTYSDRSTYAVLTPAINYFVNQLGSSMAERAGTLCVLSEKDATDIVMNYNKNATAHVSAWETIQGWRSASNLERAGNIPTHYCIDQKALNTLLTKSSYPYYCRSRTAPEKSGTYRLDWLIAQLMNPEIYHETNQIPKNREELTKKLGFDLQYSNRDLLRQYIVGSGVTQDDRVITVNPKQNVGVFTFDFNKEQVNEVEKSVRNNPLDVKTAGIEGFMQRGNGLWDYLVFDVTNQSRLNAAPGGVVDFNTGLYVDSVYPSVQAHKNFNSILNGRDCMICHMDGILSSSALSQNAVLLNEVKRKARFSETLSAQIYDIESAFQVGENALTDQIISNTGHDFTRALDVMGVRKNKIGVPLMPDFHAVYAQPLTLTELARELGTTTSALTSLLKNDSVLTTSLDVVPGSDFSKSTFKREFVEKKYCDLHAKLHGYPYEPKNSGDIVHGSYSPGASSPNASLKHFIRQTDPIAKDFTSNADLIRLENFQVVNFGGQYQILISGKRVPGTKTGLLIESPDHYSMVSAKSAKPSGNLESFTERIAIESPTGQSISIRLGSEQYSQPVPQK